MAFVIDKSNPAPIDPPMDNYLFGIVPSDTVKQNPMPNAIYVGGTGDVAIKDHYGVTKTFKAVPVGTQLLVGAAQYVLATGTTATLMVGLAAASLR